MMPRPGMMMAPGQMMGMNPLAPRPGFPPGVVGPRPGMVGSMPILGGGLNLLGGGGLGEERPSMGCYDCCSSAVDSR